MAHSFTVFYFANPKFKNSCIKILFCVHFCVTPSFFQKFPRLMDHASQYWTKFVLSPFCRLIKAPSCKLLHLRVKITGQKIMNSMICSVLLMTLPPSTKSPKLTNHIIFIEQVSGWILSWALWNVYKLGLWKQKCYFGCYGCFSIFACRARICKHLRSPGIDSSLCSLAGPYVK